MTLEEIEKFIEESLDEEKYPDMDKSWYRMRLREAMLKLRKHREEQE